MEVEENEDNSLDFEQVVNISAVIDQMNEYQICSVVRKFDASQLKEHQLDEFMHHGMTIEQVMLNQNIFNLHKSLNSNSLLCTHQTAVKFIEPTEQHIEFELYESLILHQNNIHQLNLLYAKEQINIETLQFSQCIEFLKR